MAHFSVNENTQIHYDLFPNCAPVTTFFMHGNLASNRWWMPTVELMKKQYPTGAGSIICAEFRGCGGSTSPKSESEVTMQTFASDFVSLIRSLNLGKVNLVGHSTGGLIASLMLAEAPELFNKAYLLDPVGAEGVKFDDSMIQAFEAMKIDKDLTGVVIGSTIYKNNADSDYFRNILVEDAFHAVKNVGHLVLKALDGLDIRSNLAAVDHDVMVAHGQHDTLLPMEESRKMAKLFKNGKFQVLDDCGHCTNVEQPEYFVKSMSAHLYAQAIQQAGSAFRWSGYETPLFDGYLYHRPQPNEFSAGKFFLESANICLRSPAICINPINFKQILSQAY